MSTTESGKLPPLMAQLRDSGSPEWDFYCGIIQAAHDFALKSGKENLIRFTEERMDLYGIERPVQ